MGGMSNRRRGAELERLVARKLRKWLGDEWTCVRNPTGFQAGASGRAGEFHISGGPVEFPFTIEVKRAKAFKEAQLFQSPLTGPVAGFWRQAAKQAGAVGLRPLLIVRRPPTGPILAFLRPHDLTALGTNADTSPIWGGWVAGEYIKAVRFDALISVPPSWMYELVAK